MRPKWVWRSRPGTTDSGTFSVLAAAEVLSAVAIYWGFSFWAHTQVHLLIGAILAPLLLLRSTSSVALGIEWFRHFDLDFSSASWGDRSYRRIRSIQVKYFRGKFHFLNSLFTFCLRFLAGIVISSSGLLAAFLIRVFATLRYLPSGFGSLSKNWWRTLFATDVFTRPEIIPGHANSGSLFHFDDVSDSFQKIFVLSRDEKRTSREKFVGFLFLISTVAAYAIIFGPSYVYRMSIKSTAWIHWPLAYIARPQKFSKDFEEMRLRIWADPREWLLRLFMVLTITGSLVASLPSLAQVKESFPSGVVSIVEYAFLIDVKTLFAHPWRMVALFSAAITLFITWYGWELWILSTRVSAQPDRAVPAMAWAAALEYAMRVRTVCGWVFWALVIVHAALWLASSTAWLPDYAREILQSIYGDFLPPDLRQ